MYEACKRDLDLILALSALVLSSPVWLLVSVAILLTSGRPVLFRGRRLGRGGREFGMYKFRTMRPGAETMGPGITAAGDPRITPLGRLLRRSKLDELPQLLNVLAGDMSMVGPRPEDPRYADAYSGENAVILTVRPGITGPTQLTYRHEERMLRGQDVDADYRRRLLPAKLQSDLRYVRNRSLRVDVRLILATAARLFRS